MRKIILIISIVVAMPLVLFGCNDATTTLPETATELITTLSDIPPRPPKEKLIYSDEEISVDVQYSEDQTD